MENSPLAALPPELIHRIFDYCDFRTILLYVRRVCKILYAMVDSYDRFAVTVALYANSTCTMKSVSLNLQSEKIISLTVYDYKSYNPSGHDIRTKSILSSFNSAQFTRLGSLSLKNTWDNHLECLLQSLSDAPLISLSITSYEKKYGVTWVMVLKAITRWNLQKLYMSFIDYLEEHASWPEQYSLEHLTIGRCAYSKYLHILHQLPKLRTLVMQNSMINEKKIPVTSFASTISSSLESVTIECYSLASKHLESLLLPIHSLCHLKLISTFDLFEPVFHRSYWEQLNCTQMSKIDRFEFFISFNNQNIDRKFIDFNSLIEAFRTPFWLDEKQWYVAWAYVPRSNEIWLYTVPNVMIDRKSPLRFEISSIDVTSRLTERPPNKMIGDALDQTLTTLELSQEDIGDAHTQYLAIGLRNNTTLTTMNLSRNQIGYVGAQHLADALRYNKTLAILDLSCNQIGAVGVQHLSEALRTNNSLTVLDLGSTCLGNKTYKIGDIGAQYLGSALQDNKTLTVLNIDYNGIEFTGAQHLAAGLRHNTALTTLNFDGNSIGDVGIQYFADALTANKTLTTVSLYRNDIGKAGAQYLAVALKNNTTLTTLNLESNSIGDSGAQYLADTLCNNMTLTTLNFSDNKIETIGAQYLADALINNTTLTTLDLDTNEIRADGARYIADALRNNGTLTTLNMSNNSIDANGAQHFADALRKNTVTFIRIPSISY
ncbi:hypothetical protein I4U23_011037 [Adineta vaga]|nr:hypothetical protein I4U23_011037 [Adineta vaga]